MIRVQEIRDVPVPTAEAFNYVADFTHIGVWDPGILSSIQQGDEPPGLGTRYDVVATFGRSTIPLVYEITAWQPPERVTLETSSKRFDGVDTIKFTSLGAGLTRVDYVAEFELKGIMRFSGCLVKPMFVRLARKALDGLVDAIGTSR